MKVTKQAGCHAKLLMPPYFKTIGRADSYRTLENTREYGTDRWLNQLWYRVRYGNGSETIQASIHYFEERPPL
jgi:hypothetical protein